MRSSVDVLSVDEAGQMCLTNTLAVSQAADSPSMGFTRPVSPSRHLAHLLQGHATRLPAGARVGTGLTSSNANRRRSSSTRWRRPQPRTHREAWNSSTA
jgi:hypothetical protein